MESTNIPKETSDDLHDARQSAKRESDEPLKKNQPDAIPQSEEREIDALHQRGKLKIFFGMAAGVGKSYAMLHEAHKHLKEGTDVVVGYVETHGRAETAALVEGLEILSRKHFTHIGATAEEMDTDAILLRKPELVLVDELAHTNVEGSRHTKRFQDVQELLEAGIDVFTTVNVQHLESRADTVRQITGMTVRETLPDSVLESADEIELVDIAPDELLERLTEGKIYPPDHAEHADENFFRKGNLTALREMSLRLTAERVDQQLRDYMQDKHIEETWKSGERLLVAISSSPYSEPLVRWTRRMAYTMDASWIALSVETAKPLSETDRDRLTKNLQLARELGAEIIHTTDDDIVRGILRVARQENVSQIIVGKPFKQKLWGRIKSSFQGGTVVDRLIQESDTIDVYVVRVEASDMPKQEKVIDVPLLHSDLRQYIITGNLTLMSALVCFVMFSSHIISYETVGTLMLFSTTMMALAFGRGPVLLAAVVSAALWNYFFIPPQFTWLIDKVDDVFMLGLYFIVAIVASILTSRTRTQEVMLRQREDRTVALHSLSRDLSVAVTQKDVLSVAVENIGQVFNAEIVVFLGENEEVIHPYAEQVSTFHPTPKEISVATWVFVNHKPAGKFTDTLPSAQAYYVPMLTPRGAIGVIGVRFNALLVLTLEQQTLLENFANQIASALEREKLNESSKQAEIVSESEQLYASLLRSISHEISTPLAIINSASNALQDEKTSADSELRLTLTAEIQESVGRMNRLLEGVIS